MAAAALERSGHFDRAQYGASGVGCIRCETVGVSAVDDGVDHHCVGAAHLQAGGRHHHSRVAVLRGVGCHDAAISVHDGKAASGRAAVQPEEHTALVFCSGEALGHAAATGCDQHTAGDGCLAVIIEGCIAAAGGAGHQCYAAGNEDGIVGVDAVSHGVDMDVTARNGDLAHAIGKHAASPSVSGGRAVCAAGSVQTVIGGGDVDISTGDAELAGFNALIGLQDGDVPAGDEQFIIRMNAVIAAFQGEAAAGDGQVTVGMEAVVLGIDGVRAAVDLDGLPGFQGLPGAGTFCGRGAESVPAAPSALVIAGGGRNLAAASAGDDGHCGIVSAQLRFRLDAVGACGDGQRAVGDVNVPATLILCIVGAKAVAACGDAGSCAGHHEAVLALQGGGCGRYRQRCTCDDQVILADDTVLVLAIDGEAACAVQTQVCPGKDRCISRFFIVGGAVGNVIGCIACGGDEHFVRILHVDSGAGRGGDCRAIEDELHLVLITGIDQDAAIERPRKDVHVFVRDGQGGAVQLCALAGKLTGLALGDDGHGFFAFPCAGKLPVGECEIVLAGQGSAPGQQGRHQ